MRILIVLSFLAFLPSCIFFKTLGIAPPNSISESDLLPIIRKAAISGWIKGTMFYQHGKGIPKAESFHTDYPQWLLTIYFTAPDKDVKVTRYYTKSSALNCAEAAESLTIWGTLLLLGVKRPGEISPSEAASTTRNNSISEDARTDYWLSVLVASDWAWQGCRSVLDETGNVVEFGFYRDDL